MRVFGFLQKYCPKPIIWHFWRYLQPSTVQGQQISSLGFFIVLMVRNLESPEGKGSPKRPNHSKFKFELRLLFKKLDHLTWLVRMYFGTSASNGAHDNILTWAPFDAEALNYMSTNQVKQCKLLKKKTFWEKQILHLLFFETFIRNVD